MRIKVGMTFFLFNISLDKLGTLCLYALLQRKAYQNVKTKM